MVKEFLNNQDFECFKQLIYDQSGIHFSTTNRAILESRLKERLKAVNIIQIKDYHKLIISDKEEMKRLLDSVTTNLTRFFRNTGHFKAFELVVIPNLLEHKRKTNNSRLRVWSAGCSTGEEPYTIAMILKEILPKEINIEIIASDISLKSLMIAREGFYPEIRVEGVPEKYLNKYFEKKKDGYQINDGIKDLIKFDYHNLKYDSGLKNLDVIFCRNVIIYFDDIAQKALINRFWHIMNNYSYLFIGHSESLFGMNTSFSFVKTDYTCLYKKDLNLGESDN